MADVREVNLNHLLLLEALYATHSVTAAARRVGLTQSGASNALAQLRLVFDDPLFERVGRGVRPTPVAQAVAADIEAGIGALRRALAGRAFDPSTMQRRFTLAMPDLVQAVGLPRLLARLEPAAPQCTWRVVAWPEQRVPDAIVRGEHDLFVGYTSELGSDHEHTVLYEDVYVVAARRDHPALRDGTIDLDDWLAADHVVVTSQAEGPTGVDRVLADMGRSRRIALRIENTNLVPAIVRATSLLALVDQRVARRFGGDVVVVPPPIALPVGTVRMVWAARMHDDPGLRWLREQITSVVTKGARS